MILIVRAYGRRQLWADVAVEHGLVLVHAVGRVRQVVVVAVEAEEDDPVQAEPPQQPRRPARQPHQRLPVDPWLAALVHTS